MCQRNKCSFKVILDGRAEQAVSQVQADHDGIADIEDIVTWSKKQQLCPYFLARKMSKSADLLLVPYNYLLDPKLRRRHKIDIKDRIVIVDEAHNVESVCEDAYSLGIGFINILLKMFFFHFKQVVRA